MTVDLRSDTVTQPTEEMRRAISQAELGDDVFGDDPTVNRLQQRAAELMGKEAALLVPSGTMGNQLGVLVNAPRGHSLVADSLSHTFIHEAGGSATIAGVLMQPIVTERGVISAEQLRAAVSPADDPHYAPTAAVVIEDTHNRHGGVAWPPAALLELSEAAHALGLRVHLDGARIFNAAVATDASAREIAASADTVTFCLSKGLACPVGSVFCGSAEDVREAVRWRKMLGGGMRQAGILAAAGLVALDTMIDRLADDHDNARVLAEALAEMPGVKCDLSRVQTNIVYFDVPDATRFVAECGRSGVLGLVADPGTVRFVTHLGIEREDVERAVAVAADVLSRINQEAVESPAEEVLKERNARG